MEWFKLYLPNEVRRVSIDGSLSERFSLDCGAPQGSCLGPILFIIDASELIKVVDHQLPRAPYKADDRGHQDLSEF